VDGSCDPFEVGFRASLDGEGDQFGKLVGMQLAKRVLNRAELGFGGFNEEQEFYRVFNLALPAVDGRDRSEDVDAGSQMAGDQFGGNGVGFLAEDTVVNMRRLSVIGRFLFGIGYRTRRATARAIRLREPQGTPR